MEFIYPIKIFVTLVNYKIYQFLVLIIESIDFRISFSVESRSLDKNKYEVELLMYSRIMLVVNLVIHH